MNIAIIKRLIVPYLLISAALFYVLFQALAPDTLIMTLNALFIGTMVSISVSYGAILVPAIIGIKPYDDVRVLAIGIFGGWLAYGIVVIGSIYVRSADLPTSTLAIAAFGRWVAINSAIIQIVAPDFNSSRSFFEGRDRKLLILGLAAGVVFAIATYMLQAQQALEI